jgi:pilus assembly protein CpaB
MKPKTLMLVVVAVGCGLVASYMTSRLLAERSSGPPPEPRVEVLVAKTTVPAWVPIKDPDKYFVIKEVPESAVPKKALREMKDVKDQRLMTPLSEDDYVVQDKLINKDQAGLQGRMPAGTRAVAIKVNAESLAGGFVLPGSYVDVISTLRGGVGESVSKVIMQNMLVLAVDTNHQRDPQQQAMLGSTVTLAATPAEASRLALASNLGELRLTLRGMGDNAIVKLQSTHYDDLDKPAHSAGENGAGAEPEEVVVPPPVPAKLPALAPPPPPAPVAVAKKEEEPKDEPPAQTHTMTIVSGESVQKAVFLLDADGKNWSDAPGGSEGDAASPPRRPAAPAAPAVAPVQPDALQGALQGGGLPAGLPCAWPTSSCWWRSWS